MLLPLYLVEQEVDQSILRTRMERHLRLVEQDERTIRRSEDVDHQAHDREFPAASEGF
jgi:hypothetical protein